MIIVAYISRWVILQPALYCIGDPVLEYIITLSDSEVNRDKITKILLSSNETEVTIGTSDGLNNNIVQYLYKVTARNRIGNTTSSGNIISKLALLLNLMMMIIS